MLFNMWFKITSTLELNYLPRINRAGERQSYGTNARVDFSTKSTFRFKKKSTFRFKKSLVEIRNAHPFGTSVTSRSKSLICSKICKI